MQCFAIILRLIADNPEIALYFIFEGRSEFKSFDLAELRFYELACLLKLLEFICGDIRDAHDWRACEGIDNFISDGVNFSQRRNRDLSYIRRFLRSYRRLEDLARSLV